MKGITDSLKGAMPLKNSWMIGQAKKTGFDIIFSDPPYRQFLVKNCLLRIAACDILNPSGILGD